jgi:alpha-beta hydrolase superfamily lysophospholipase
MNIARVAGSILIFALLAYLGITLLVYFIAEKIIFQPQRASYRDTPEIIKLDRSEGVQISALYLQNPEARYTILFSHGNAEDIGTALPTLMKIKEAGFSVFAFDYQGYGTSSGLPSEAGAYGDTDVAYNYLVNKLEVPPERVIAHGRSLGGAVAVDLAQRYRLGGLIVESSFITAYRVVTDLPLFPFDKFESISKIKRIHCPVLVIHGKRDEVIPFRHGEKLFEAANEPKLFWWVEEAGHNNLLETAGSSYEKTLRDFANSIEGKLQN